MRRVILVIDDDPAVLRSYGHLFQRLDCQVLLVDDSDTVLSDPESLHGVDVMILDQRMPKTTGLDLLACLRRRGAGGTDTQVAPASHPAVILISAYLSEAIRERAARLGVIEKPVDTAHLLACVRAALAERPPCP